MKIIQAEIYKSPIALKKPFVTSLGPDTHARNVIVVLRTDDGLTGFGECSPYLPINGESMNTAFEVGGYLANAMVGQDALDIARMSALADRVIYGNSSIKSAFDIALHDLAAQRAGLPLYKFLGDSNSKTLVTDYTVSIASPEEMAASAAEIVARGFTVVKVKLGGEPDEDVQRIRRIRERIGHDIPLRIDANQGWSVNEAIDVLGQLSTSNIQFCEEPIARHAFMHLRQVRDKSEIPVMADESCFDEHDAKRLIALEACDAFNIKLGKSSGIFKAMKIAALASAASLPVQVGGFLESRLAFTASAHFSLACPTARYTDFDTPLMFIDDPVCDGITYDAQGVITVPELPGLGASFPDAYLEQLEVQVVRHSN